jgi:hypothetical protein
VLSLFNLKCNMLCFSSMKILLFNISYWACDCVWFSRYPEGKCLLRNSHGEKNAFLDVDSDLMNQNYQNCTPLDQSCTWYCAGILFLSPQHYMTWKVQPLQQRGDHQITLKVWKVCQAEIYWFNRTKRPITRFYSQNTLHNL